MTLVAKSMDYVSFNMLYKKMYGRLNSNRVDGYYFIDGVISQNRLEYPLGKFFISYYCGRGIFILWGHLSHYI